MEKFLFKILFSFYVVFKRLRGISKIKGIAIEPLNDSRLLCAVLLHFMFFIVANVISAVTKYKLILPRLFFCALLTLMLIYELVLSLTPNKKVFYFFIEFEKEYKKNSFLLHLLSFCCVISIPLLYILSYTYLNIERLDLFAALILTLIK